MYSKGLDLNVPNGLLLTQLRLRKKYFWKVPKFPGTKNKIKRAEILKELNTQEQEMLQEEGDLRSRKSLVLYHCTNRILTRIGKEYPDMRSPGKAVQARAP